MKDKLVNKSGDLVKDLVNDTISRQAAIAAVSKGCAELRGVFGRCEKNILALPSVQPKDECEYWDSESSFCALHRPSAQPERKKGKWIERNPQNSPDCRLIECSECGNAYIVGYNINYDDWIDGRNFCMKCGSDLRGWSNDKNT